MMERNSGPKKPRSRIAQPARARIKLPKDQSYPILEKDRVILWGKAAGRCSMPCCRTKLAHSTQSGETKTLGEAAHIVGEKRSKLSPRGISNLTLADRRLYSNLILLCRHHHSIIDKDETRYTVEKLHKIKSQHEEYVENQLSGRNEDPDNLVFANLIDQITLGMQLTHWAWLTDNAVRSIIPLSFVDAREHLNQALLATIWPKKHKPLTEAIRSVLDSFDRFLSCYLSNAEIGDNPLFYKEDMSYKNVFQNPNYNKHVEYSNAWAKACFWSLCDLTIKLNRYAAAVRKYINPMYFRVAGRFLIHDSNGMFFGNKPTLFCPTPKHTIKELNDAVRKKNTARKRLR